ncbi:MAG: hypothetical protein IIZ39_01095, partial [Blautia sp.]|nr:hypothetical protein [Blautia sp.]
EVASCMKVEGIFSYDEDGEEYPITAEDFTDILEEVELQCLGSSAPNMEDLYRKEDEYSSEQLKDMGLDMESLIRRMDEKYKNSIHIPDAPQSSGVSEARRNYLDFIEYVDNHKDARYTISVSDQTMEEMLSSRLDRKEVFEICKYVQEMDALDRTDQERAHAIAEAFKKNPSLLLYATHPVGDLDDLLSIPAFAEKGEAILFTSAFVTIISLSLGSFDGKGTVLVAKDLLPCLQKLTKSKITEMKRLLAKYDQGMNVLMRNYGVIEFTAIRDLMKKYFSVSLPQKQTNQIVYLRYSYDKQLKTFVLENRHLYAASLEVDLDKVMPGFYMGMADMFPYAEMEEREIELWQNMDPMDFMEVYPGWSYLNAFLVMNGKMNQEKAKEYLTLLYLKVRNGETLQQIMKFFKMQNKGMDLLVRLRLWEICLHFVAGTGLPGLKGACQAQADHDPRYLMAMASMFVENPVAESNIDQDTHIDVFPTKIQLQVGSILFTLEEEDLPTFRKIQRRFPDNIDLQFILGSAYQRLGHFKEAIEVFEKLKGRVDAAKDDSVNIVLRMCHNEEMNRPMALYLDGMLKM